MYIKMKKLILTFILGIFLLNSMFALDSLGVGKQNQNFTFCQTCSDATYITLSTLQYPDKTVIPINDNMTASGSSFCYNITTTSQLGRYDVTGISDGCEKTFAAYFEISYSGDELSTGNSIFYAALIFIMILLLVGTIYGAEKLPSTNEKDEEGKIMSVKWGKYLRAPLYFIAWIIFIAILFITSNLAFAYLGEQLFAKVLFNLYKICFAITPVIVVVWFVWFFVKIFQDKKLNGYISRGLYPQEKKSKW